MFSLFSFSARKDIIAEAVYVASASIQSKKNGWFEGSCGINLSEDLSRRIPRLFPSTAILSFYFHLSFLSFFQAHTSRKKWQVI